MVSYCSVVKSVISSPRDSAIPPIITDNGDVIVEDYNKATHFNKFFAKSAVQRITQQRNVPMQLEKG